MKFPFSWLNDFIDLTKIISLEGGNVNSAVEKIASKLTKAGIEVEDVKEIFFYKGNLVVGKVEAVSEHPTNQKHKVCEVNIGKSENKIIVTGDTTIQKGCKVAYCFPGTILQDQSFIDAKEFDGIVSDGMLVSLEELGIEPKSQYLWRINENWEVGREIKEYISHDFLDYKEFVFSLKPPSNRANILSVWGIAIELSALYGIPIKTLDFSNKPTVHNKPNIIVQDKRCLRYCSRIVYDVEIKESKDNIKIRLLLSGLRPINNIVDATNYVMLAIGQPMHAFDLDKLKGKKIIVRSSRENEKMLTLDGIELTLDNNTLIIADEEKPVALAGVIGGEDTSITNETKNVLFESAYFDYDAVRNSVSKYKINTESSNRFSRNIGFYTTDIAIDMAIQLLSPSHFSQMTDIKTKPLENLIINTSIEEINSRLGSNITVDNVNSILSNLGFTVNAKGTNINTIVPAYRMDVSIVEDIFEEIARIYSYDRIPESFPKIRKNPSIPSNEIWFEQKLRDTFVGLGFTEVMNFSFVSERDIELLGIDKDITVSVENPMNADEKIIRPYLFINVLKNIKFNMNYGFKNMRLFEIGKVFLKNYREEFNESKNLCVVLNNMRIDSWSQREKFTYYDLSDIFHLIFGSLGKTEVKPVKHPFLHDYISGIVFFNGHQIGFIGKLHPMISKKLEIGDTFILELNISTIETLINRKIRFNEINRFPVSPRNISVIVPKHYYLSDLIEFIKSYEISNYDLCLNEVRIVDIYEGNPIPEGFKSVNILIKYQGMKTTQKEDNVNLVYYSLIKDIENKLGLKVRTSQT